MDANTLRTAQQPLKQAYREDPAAALVTLERSGAVGAGVTCSVGTGRALAKAGLHPATGGDGLSLCSGDMLLEALVACAGVTLGAVAAALGIELTSATVHAEGDIDFRGTLGVSKEAPVGFAAIRLRFDVETDAEDDAVAKLLELSERYCVVLQTIRGATAVESSSRRIAPV
jgi:uncharacterized OsmC-like protein